MQGLIYAESKCYFYIKNLVHKWFHFKLFDKCYFREKKDIIILTSFGKLTSHWDILRAMTHFQSVIIIKTFYF